MVDVDEHLEAPSHSICIEIGNYNCGALPASFSQDDHKYFPISEFRYLLRINNVIEDSFFESQPTAEFLSKSLCLILKFN